MVTPEESNQIWIIVNNFHDEMVQFLIKADMKNVTDGILKEANNNTISRIFAKNIRDDLSIDIEGIDRDLHQHNIDFAGDIIKILSDGDHPATYKFGKKLQELKDARLDAISQMVQSLKKK